MCEVVNNRHSRSTRLLWNMCLTINSRCDTMLALRVWYTEGTCSELRDNEIVFAREAGRVDGGDRFWWARITSISCVFWTSLHSASAKRKTQKNHTQLKLTKGCLRGNTVPWQHRNVMRKSGFRSYAFCTLHSTLSFLRCVCFLGSRIEFCCTCTSTLDVLVFKERDAPHLLHILVSLQLPTP